MKKSIQKQPFVVILAALTALVTTGQAQVTFQDVTNGLVDFYPLGSVSPENTNTTPDYITRRDMTLHGMSAGNIVAGNHPGMGNRTTVFDFSQSPGATVITYQSTGQDPLTGEGDYLPFINQRGATMNFWIKGAVPPAQDSRVMAECANNGDGNPFFSLSSEPASKLGLGYFLRANNNNTTDTNGTTVNVFDDGTYQTPSFYYIWSQSSQYTTNTLFDDTWHMLTTIITTNGDIHVYVDGIYDAGGTPATDSEGNPSMAASLSVTNTYYETHAYPLVDPPTTNPPPNGFVRWMIPGLNVKGAFTTFGGFDRNGSIAGGVPSQMSDVGFWDRALTSNEIQFVMTNGFNTNGVFALTLNTNVITINSFMASFGEVGQGHTVNLSWNVSGASGSPGGIVISGVGDVSSTPIGSTNITLTGNQTYTFTLTAHNGLVPDQEQSVSVKTFPGVPSDWNLVQRFDGLFTPTTAGISGNGWVSLLGYYGGTLDRFNVVTVNGNEVLSPKSGYVPNVDLSIGHDTPGALAYGNLNALTIPPNQSNTLFFRFSLRDPQTYYASNNVDSGLDFALGLSDYGWAEGPPGGADGPTAPGQAGSYGPAMRIVRSDPGYQPSPFDLQAQDYGGAGVTNSYSYVSSVDANGLQTNVNYMVWMDVANYDTHAIAINGSSTNNFTTNEPVYSVWLQKQGDPSRTLLFSGYHGDRDYVGYNPANDSPVPFLKEVYTSVATESFANAQVGAFFETNNMLLLDDFYLSTDGYNSTVPRLFDLTSIVRGANDVTINWNSLGSLFQTNTYSVQRTFSLTNPNWVTLTNGLPSGGDTTSFTDDTAGSSDTAFYRISWP